MDDEVVNSILFSAFLEMSFTTPYFVLQIACVSLLERWHIWLNWIFVHFRKIFRQVKAKHTKRFTITTITSHPTYKIKRAFAMCCVCFKFLVTLRQQKSFYSLFLFLQWTNIKKILLFYWQRFTDIKIFSNSIIITHFYPRRQQQKFQQLKKFFFHIIFFPS